jgi:hypothetical protein
LGVIALSSIHREAVALGYRQKEKEPASLAANFFAVPGSSVRALHAAKCIQCAIA